MYVCLTTIGVDYKKTKQKHKKKKSRIGVTGPKSTEGPNPDLAFLA